MQTAIGGRPGVFIALPARIIIISGPAVDSRLAVLTREKLRPGYAAPFLVSAVTNAATRAGNEHNEVVGGHVGTLCTPKFGFENESITPRRDTDLDVRHQTC